jgi:hypothetical protein
LGDSLVLRISLTCHVSADVPSLYVTFDGDTLSLWDRERKHVIARYRMGEVASIEVVPVPGSSASVGSISSRVTADVPNAYRRWSTGDEDAIVEAYHRGDSLDQIAALVGRRVGGVRSRLLRLRVIEREPGDGISFPGLQPVRQPGDGETRRQRQRDGLESFRA